MRICESAADRMCAGTGGAGIGKANQLCMLIAATAAKRPAGARESGPPAGGAPAAKQGGPRPPASGAEGGPAGPRPPARELAQRGAGQAPTTAGPSRDRQRRGRRRQRRRNADDCRRKVAGEPRDLAPVPFMPEQAKRRRARPRGGGRPKGGPRDPRGPSTSRPKVCTGRGGTTTHLSP